MCRSICHGEYQNEEMVLEITTYRLQGEALKNGVEFQRKTVTDINEVFSIFPAAKAVFNCTGIGSYSLKGVEDKSLYPTRVRILAFETSNSY